MAATRGLAVELDVVVLLKGPTTVIATPRGDVLVVDHGDERLATAGSGDVLAGIIGALLAAGLAPERAAAAAAWLHADAAGRGPVAGLLAGDIVELIPSVARVAVSDVEAPRSLGVGRDRPRCDPAQRQ